LPSTFASFLIHFPREGDATARLRNQSFLDTRWRRLASKSPHEEGHREGGPR